MSNTAEPNVSPATERPTRVGAPWYLRIWRGVLSRWVKSPQVFPEPLVINTDAPVLYVLSRPTVSDVALLAEVAEAQRQASPFAILQLGNRRLGHSWMRLQEGRKAALPQKLNAAIEAVGNGSLEDIALLPVSVFWGRKPEREAPEGVRMRWLRAWAAEGWGGRTRLNKWLAILMFRRSVTVKFGAVLSLRQILAEAKAEGLDHERTVRRIARQLRVQFRNEREAAIGPDLSHRRTLMASILAEPRVQEAIVHEAEQKKLPVANVEARAEASVLEIAADYSYFVVQLGEKLLRRLWNRIYEGVNVSGSERLQALAKDHTLVYVPCHRSHIDYLLLSYVVHKSGLAIPHIAAGANLNLPIIGGLLRRGGAFFIRRSFKDDALYGEVFAAYVHEVLKRGFPMEYFVEGGRSRTGRMLPPKAGLISMTVQSYLREHQRPLLFVPVYIGYEKLIEGGSYTQEMAGAAKRKESIWGLFSSVWSIRRNHYGSVAVGFAEPIALSELLKQQGVSNFEQWLADKSLRRDSLTVLSRQIAERINSAAHLNAINLVATAILATPRHAADVQLLAAFVEKLPRLALVTGLTPYLTMTPQNGSAAIEQAIRLGYLRRQSHPLGDVVSADAEAALALAYFRNNLLHVFALPGLIACLLLQYGSLGRVKLERMAKGLYALLAYELYLPGWLDGDAFEAFDRSLQVLVDEKWLRKEAEANVYSVSPATTAEAQQLEVLAAVIRPALIRHALMLALVVRDGSGQRTREDLEKLSQQAAQHFALTHVFNAPEFADRAQFGAAFEALLRTEGLYLDEVGCVHFTDSLAARAEELSYLLPADTRMAILRVAQAHPAPAHST